MINVQIQLLVLHLLSCAILHFVKDRAVDMTSLLELTLLSNNVATSFSNLGHNLHKVALEFECAIGGLP